jgi:hypothetical protein
MRDVTDAMANNGRTVYKNTTEESVKSMAKREAVDKEAGYHAAVQHMDKKISRKKDSSDATRMNNTETR